MTAAITVRHNFETAHRLPNMGSAKCVNLHGHSWWVTVTVEANDVDDRGAVVEFGEFKAGLRAWIDTNLDHGAMLEQTDPLADLLEQAGSKVYRTGVPPTVENTARLLFTVAENVLAGIADSRARAWVARVDVTETHVNGASWTR